MLLLHSMSPQVGTLRHFTATQHLIAFGPKRTSTSRQEWPDQSRMTHRRRAAESAGSLGPRYVTFTFQKIGALNLRTSRTFFRKAVG